MYNENTNIRSESRFLNKTFMYMAIALLITFSTAFIASNVGFLANLFAGNLIIFFVLAGVELLLVVNINRNIARYTREQLLGRFFLYSILNGLTFTSVFLIFKLGSIAGIFLVAAGMFFCSAMVGITIKRDLSMVGRIAIMAVVGLIGVNLLGIFIPGLVSSSLINIIGVVTFCALTAYDVQKVKNIHNQAYYGDPETLNKYAIVAALSIYLDFINLFMYLLRLFGSERD